MTALEKLVLALAKAFFAIFPFERGKQTAANAIYLKLLPGIKGQTLFKVGTIKYRLDLHDRIQAIFYMTKLYETETLNAAFKILSVQKDDPVILDVGANVGLMSLQIKDHFPTAKIHLFEADPTVYRQLVDNIELNQLTDLKVNKLAVSAISGESLTFVKSISSMESGWGRIQNEENKNYTAEKYIVQSVSIDQYLKDHQITHVDLLKIDVEGAEALVLKGAAFALRAKIIRTIICEINPAALSAFASSPEEISLLLASFGYAFVRQVDMNSIYSTN